MLDRGASGSLNEFDAFASGATSETLLEAQKNSLEMVVKGAPLGEVLAYLTRIVEHQAGGGVVAAILLLDDQGRLFTGAGPSLPDSYNRAIDGLKARDDLGTCSVAAVTGKVVVTPDIDADPKWSPIKHLPLGLGLRAAWSQPIVARSGRVLGTFGTYFRECREPRTWERRLVEVLSHTASLAIERNQYEEALEQQRRIHDAALDAADMGTWRYTLADHICRFSSRAQRLYGVEAERFLHDDKGVYEILHPDDVPRMWAAVQAACHPENRRYNVEYRVRRRDGGWRWLSAWGVVEFDGEGEGVQPVAIIGASRDITARKEAEARQELLVDELSHRVKNTLAIIQSIAAQTLRHTPDPVAFKSAFSARLSALARAHSLLTKELWHGASLSEIVSGTLSPFGDERRPEAIRAEGPPIVLKPNAAVTLSLVLHELATNAAKHGALSNQLGRVELEWRRAEKDRMPLFELCWRERNGPPVREPRSQGFGSRLIMASASQLGGTVDLSFNERGAECRFVFPLAENANI